MDSKVQLAQATNVNLKTVFGIALNDAAINQPVDVQFGGTITLSVGTQGVPFFLSENLGKIAPIADLVTSGAGVRPLGIGNGTGLEMQVFNSGVDIP